MTAVDQAVRIAADAFADAVGEDRSKVRIVDDQWKGLLKAGVVVNIHCTGWPAETKLTLDMLGIYPNDDKEQAAYESAVDLGRLLMLPKSVLKQAQSYRNRFRNALADRCFHTRWGDLVPQHKYLEWKAEAVKIQAQYAAFAQGVYNLWDDYTEIVEVDYRIIGYKNFQTLVDAGRGPAMSQQEWVDAFVQRCMAKRETKDYWLASMKMWWDDPTYVPPATMTIDEAKTEMERDILNGLQEGLFQFVSDVRGEITDKVFNVCVDVLTAMDKEGGELPRNSSKQLKNLIDAVDSLKFWNDESLESKMAKVSAMLDQRACDRNYEDMQDTLRQIGAEARILLGELGRPVNRRSRQVGIPEEEPVVGTILRSQRRTLDVDDAPAVTFSRQQRKLELVTA